MRILVACVCGAVAAACGQADSVSSPPAPATTIAPASLLGPCRDGDEKEQRHGATCLCCHSDELGVGGSIDRAGPPVARVVVTDARGEVANVAPNPFANFLRHYPLVPPLRAAVIGPDGRVAEMVSDAPSADCNRCHWAGGAVAPIHGP
jgi:hypothetical protein